jgi:hypothetical protein
MIPTAIAAEGSLAIVWIMPEMLPKPKYDISLLRIVSCRIVISTDGRFGGLQIGVGQSIDLICVSNPTARQTGAPKMSKYQFTLLLG